MHIVIPSSFLTLLPSFPLPPPFPGLLVDCPPPCPLDHSSSNTLPRPPLPLRPMTRPISTPPSTTGTKVIQPTHNPPPTLLPAAPLLRQPTRPSRLWPPNRQHRAQTQSLFTSSARSSHPRPPPDQQMAVGVMSRRPSPRYPWPSLLFPLSFRSRRLMLGIRWVRQRLIRACPVFCPWVRSNLSLSSPLAILLFLLLLLLLLQFLSPSLLMK